MGTYKLVSKIHQESSRWLVTRDKLCMRVDWAPHTVLKVKGMHLGRKHQGIKLVLKFIEIPGILMLTCNNMSQFGLRFEAHEKKILFCMELQRIITFMEAATFPCHQIKSPVTITPWARHISRRLATQWKSAEFSYLGAHKLRGTQDTHTLWNTPKGDMWWNEMRW